MLNLEDLKYTKEHVWVKIDNNRVTLGITDTAQTRLGDVVFIELPKIGEQFGVNDSLARIESVKAVSDVICPVSGMVIEVNTRLESSPELINGVPYGEGWIAVLEVSDEAELENLLSVQDYGKFLIEGDE